MQIAVHDYRTTERVGTLDIDEVSGAVRYLDGPAELEEWAASVADGFYTTRSHCTADCCYLGTWINLVRNPAILTLLQAAGLGTGLPLVDLHILKQFDTPDSHIGEKLSAGS